MNFWKLNIQRKIRENLGIIKWIIVLTKLKNKKFRRRNFEAFRINKIIWRKGEKIALSKCRK